MNQDKTYYQLIPEKIFNNLSEIENLLSSEIKNFSPDYLKEVISIVAWHIRKDEGPTPLRMWDINKMVLQGQYYLTGLVSLGVIVRSGNPVKYQTSYKYNFAPDYQSTYIKVPLNNTKLIWRIETVQEKLRKKDEKSLWGYLNQTRYLKKLTIDDDYIKFIESNYTNDTDQYNSVLASATRIIRGDIRYNRDTTSGRFHSNLTNMAKGLRPYVRINGESLVNLDVKNSQPYLSTIILTDPSKVSYMTTNPVFALLLQNLKVSQNEDVKKYIQLVALGQLYEYLMQEFNLTRDETKRQVLRILFARNRMPKDEVNRKCRLIFQDRFPTVHRIFSKVRGHSKGDKFQNFKRFAILLQRIESYLMLDVILKRIYKELPGTIAVTIHDSIMTGILTNNVEAVRKIMDEELTRFITFRPKINIERELKGKEREEEEEIILNQYAITNLVSYN